MRISLDRLDQVAVGYDELDLLELLAQDLQPGLFVDVGASIGRFSKRFAELGWRVVAFEPEPGLAQEFRNRIGGPGVRLIQRAVSDVDDERRPFYLSTEHWGIHSLKPFHESHREQIEVTTTRLDSVLLADDYRGPIFLKIDVEGADFPALKSWDFDATEPRVVMLEFMDSRTSRSFGYVLDDVIEFMDALDYTPYISEWTPVKEYSRRGIESSEPPGFIGVFRPPLHHRPSWGNALFVHRDETEWLEETLVRYLSSLALHSGRLIDQAASKSSQLEHVSATLEHRERSLDEIQAVLAKRESRILELDEAIKQRDSRISELDEAIKQRDSRISELDEAIKQRDSRISELDEAIKQRDQVIDNYGQIDQEQKQRLRAVTAEAHRAQNEAESLRRSPFNRLWLIVKRLVE